MAHTPTFRRMLSDIDKGVLLKPRVQRYFIEGVFPEDFAVHFHSHDLDHGPDGWFHPSTHPLWPSRLLWYYLHEGDKLLSEGSSYMRTLSLTIGSALHGFIQRCLEHEGVLLSAAEMVYEGWDVGPTGECSLEDASTRSRGHQDGILRLFYPPQPELTRQAFEFKTSNTMKLGRIEDMDLDGFRDRWPEYYAQAQEYMRMSKLQVTVVLMMGLGYPWEMREFHITADPAFQHAVVSKYREAQGDELPMPCCTPRSKTAAQCPARLICPVGQA